MTIGKMKLRVVALLIILAPLWSAASETEWLVAPYVWLTDVTLDQSSGVSGGISASDLLDKSDSVGMIRVEAARNRWGLTLDYLWLGVSGGVSVPLPMPILGVNPDQRNYKNGFIRHRFSPSRRVQCVIVGPRII